MNPSHASLRLSFCARLLLLSMGLAVFSGCVHQPLMAPEKGGSPWTEVTSAHFVLKTDLDSHTAEEVSAKLEEIFAALADLGFPSAQQPKLRIEVVYLRLHEDYVVLAPKLTGGVFFPEGLHDFERTPIAILGGDFVQATRETLQHELTHLFIHYYYPQAPPWLNEGLARYMETMSIEEGVVVLGRESRRERFWKGPLSVRSDPSGDRALLPMSEAPAPSELRSMSPAQFYGNRDLDPTTNEGHQAAVTMAEHYVAAWSLVHLLLTNDRYAPTFGKYLDRIHDGASEAAAWQETVGRMSAQALTEDYQRALVPEELMLVRAKWGAPPYAAESNRPMTSGEVHVLWAQLRPQTPGGRAAAQSDLTDAVKLGDDSGDLALVRAFWLAEQHAISEAQAALREALAEHPQDPRIWNALGRLTVQASSRDDGVLAPPAKKAIADIAEHLAPIATSAAQLDLLASFSAMQGNPDAALTYEKRAVAVDPNCVSCLAEAARIFYGQGRVREALETATLALGLLPENRRMPQLSAFVETCRSRLASSTESGPPPANLPRPGAAAAKR